MGPVILVKSPLRVNFLGGGSDFEEIFTRQGGAVFGTSIDLYVYLSAALVPPFASEKFRFTYRKTESVNDALEFEHPVVRETFSEQKWLPPLNLATMSDVPGNSGLGSSSSFTVGLIKLLSRLQKSGIPPSAIASEAIRIERKVLGEVGGWQDQLHAAHGGVNLFEFLRDGTVKIKKISSNDEVIKLLNNSMFLVPLVGERSSSQLSSKYIRDVDNDRYLELVLENSHLARQLAEDFTNEDFSASKKIKSLGVAMRRAWAIKLETNPSVELSQADNLIKKGIDAGALAGKLCGAGESGFIFFLHEAKSREKILNALDSESWISIKSSYGGATVVYEGIDEPLVSDSTWGHKF